MAGGVCLDGPFYTCDPIIDARLGPGWSLEDSSSHGSPSRRVFATGQVGGWACQPCSSRVADRVDDQGSTFQFVWPVPEPHDTRRETRSPAARTSQLQCSDAAVGPWRELTCPKPAHTTFILAARRPFLTMFSNLHGPSRLTFQPVGSSLEPVHPNTEKEPSRGQQHFNANRGTGLGQPKEAPRKCGATVK